jgi:hypothetical protein
MYHSVLHKFKGPCKLGKQAAGRIAITMFLLAFTVGSAHAQYRASLRGVVTDPQGAIVPGAKVTLTNTETGAQQVSVTGDDGLYNFNALPPARFSIALEKSGFKTKTIDQVLIIPEQANALNLRLEVGDATQTVTVNGSESPAMDTETASVSGTVTSNEIQHLPSFGRDVFQLAQLAPGVFGNGAQGAGGGSSNLPGTQGPGGTSANSGIFQTENGPQISSGGGQYESNSITVDGISTVSAVWGGTTIITPSEDSIGDMKIVSNSYDAENGRFSGAQMQVTSKSGTNDIHGSAFIKLDRPGLNAYQRWNGPSSELPGTPAARGVNRDSQRFNDIGGSLGGPIWKNRVFAFFNYETIRLNSNVTDQNWYETSQFHNLAPSGSIAATLLAFPGEQPNAKGLVSQTCAQIGLLEGQNCQTISGQGLDVGSPLKSSLGAHDPTYQGTGNPGVGSGLDGVPDIQFVTTENPTQTTEEQYTGRLDADVTSRDRISFSIYWVPVNTTSYQGPIRPANFWHHSQINEAVSPIWNHTFSPTLLNEARANAAGWRWNELGSNSQAPFGLPQDNFDGLGNIGGASGNSNPLALQYLGAPPPSILNQWTYSYRDILTKVLGRHNLKFGGELTRLYYLNSNYGAARPNYNFRNPWDFLNDAPYQERGSFNPLTGLLTANRLDERENLWGFFAQDDFKIRPNLTLNLGLRWSYFGAMYSKQNNLGVALLGSGANALTDLRVRTGGHLYNPQKNNFGPQIGFAWQPIRYQGKLVVRGGFGVNYNQNEIAITANGAANPPSIVGVTFCCSSFDNPDPNVLYAVPSDPKSYFGYPSNPATIQSFGANNLPLNAGSPIQVIGFPANPGTIMTYHFSLDNQVDLGHQWIASLGYSGTLGRHIITQNQHNVLAAVAGIPFNPTVNNLDWFDNNGSSNYHALLAGLKHQFSHSFLADAEYTWAKTMDTGSGPYEEDPYPTNTKLAYGRSDFYVGNAFKLYGLWQPTIFHGSHGWLEKVAGGWSISGIFNLHSGFPWTPIYSVPGGNLYYTGSGYGTLRPAAVLGGAGRDTSNGAFKSGPGGAHPSTYNKNYSNGPSAYFKTPTTANGTPFSNSTQPPPFPGTGNFPQGPGVARNSLNGPGYNDLDATLTKAFGLPAMPVLGENARFEVRADAYNFFNKTNLHGGGQSNGGGISDQITNSNFGQAQSALGSRTVELQARFSF